MFIHRCKIWLWNIFQIKHVSWSYTTPVKILIRHKGGIYEKVLSLGKPLNSRETGDAESMMPIWRHCNNYHRPIAWHCLKDDAQQTWAKCWHVARCYSSKNKLRYGSKYKCFRPRERIGNYLLVGGYFSQILVVLQLRSAIVGSWRSIHYSIGNLQDERQTNTILYEADDIVK